jgi:hypothetical protein
MKPQEVKFVFGAGLLILLFFIFTTGSLRAQAQTAGVTLTGTITDTSGKPVPNAKISVKNMTTGKSTELQANTAGVYDAAGLEAGEYEVSASAGGFSSKAAKVTLAEGASQTLDLALSPELSLEGLGFPKSQTQGSAQEQARLDKRTHMLKTHQRLGLITAAPMLATVITGGLAGGKSTASSDRDLHAALGSLTTGMYFTTAAFAIFAPKVPGTQTRGPIRVHKALAWIHGPGMVLTPILGIMAFQQKSNGEKLHGMASAHVPVAIVTASAYGAALLAVSVKF